MYRFVFTSPAYLPAEKRFIAWTLLGPLGRWLVMWDHSVSGCLNWLQSRYDSLDSCSALDNPEDNLLADMPCLGTQAPSTPMGMCYAPVPQTPRMRTVPMYPKSVFAKNRELPPFQVCPTQAQCMCRPVRRSRCPLPGSRLASLLIDRRSVICELYTNAHRHPFKTWPYIR